MSPFRRPQEIPDEAQRARAQAMQQYHDAERLAEQVHGVLPRLQEIREHNNISESLEHLFSGRR